VIRYGHDRLVHWVMSTYNVLAFEISNIQRSLIDKIRIENRQVREYQFSLFGHAPGIYLIRVLTKENMVTKKIVKL